jgi:hypothetical protein
MPRLGPPTHAIIANRELVTVVVVGVTVLGEKLTPTSTLGGGLILAGFCCTGGCASHREIELPKNPRSPLNKLPPARHREMPHGRSLYPQQPATAFATHNGR